MATHNNCDSSTANDVQGEAPGLVRAMLEAMKTGAVGGFRDALRSFFLPVLWGWRGSLLLVRRLRPIIEPALAAAIMFAALLLLGLAAQAVLSPLGL